MADENEYLTESEREELVKYLTGYGTPIPEDKQNIHSFLQKVITSDDTTKVGNITEDELGTPRNPVRTIKELELFSRDIIKNQLLADYFQRESEIITATSLSKNAKLLDLSVINRRQVQDITKPRKVNKGWFKKGNKEGSHDE